MKNKSNKDNEDEMERRVREEINELIEKDNMYSLGAIESDEEWTAVKEVMKENNFIRTGSSPDMYENDTGLYHKTLEFAKERMEI